MLQLAQCHLQHRLLHMLCHNRVPKAGTIPPSHLSSIRVRVEVRVEVMVIMRSHAGLIIRH